MERTEWQERMGVGERLYNVSRLKGTTRIREVSKDEGPGVAGYQRDHWDGRVDAKVTGAVTTVNPNLKARRVHEQEG